MSKVKSLEELMKIKEEALQNIKMRESGKEERSLWQWVRVALQQVQRIL